MENDSNYVTEMEARLEYYQHEIMKFRIIAEVAKPDEQVRHYQIIEDLVEKEEAVIEKVHEFKDSQAVDRTTIKDEISMRQRRLDDAIEAARVKIN